MGLPVQNHLFITDTIFKLSEGDYVKMVKFSNKKADGTLNIQCSQGSKYSYSTKNFLKRPFVYKTLHMFVVEFT